MPKISETFNIGDRSNITPERMLDLMEEMYRDLAISINRKPDIVERSTDALPTETFLSNGDININLSTNKVQMVTNHPTAATITLTQLS